MTPSLLDTLGRYALELVLGLFLLLVLAAGLATATLRWGLRRLAGRRPLPARSFLLHAAAGLVFAAATSGFVLLARAVVAPAGLVAFDLALAGALQDAATLRVRTFLGAVTWLGSGWTLAALTLGLAGLLLHRRHRLLAAGWVVAMLGGGLLNQALKELFQRARPAFALRYESWSFPSGHAMGSLVAAGMVTYLAAVLLPRRAALALGLAGLLLVLLVGLSRLYLGVHYFSDVIAGYAGGLVWLAVCITATEVARRGRRAIPPAGVRG